MPTLNYRVESTGINILKAVTDEVVTGLLDELDLTRSFANSVYITSSFQTNSNFSNDNGAVKMVSSNRCDVEANYIMDKSQVPWPVDTQYNTPAMGTRVTQKGIYTPILVDPKAGILIEHRTSACAIELEFGLTFTTFDEASKAFDTIQNRYKGQLIGTPFHLMFSYPVSFEMYKFLIAAYEAKQDYKTKTFMDWINDMKKSEISWDIRKADLADPAADKALMIRCRQLNCLLQLTMDQKEPDTSKIDQLPDTYKISFTAVIQFGRPTMVNITTPISIDNTPLPDALFSSVAVDTHYSATVAGVYQDLMCNEFMRRTYGNFNTAHQLVRIPAYDDWLSLDQQFLFYQYRPFLIAHFTLDGAITTIDLKDLGDVSLHPIVKEIMRETKDSLFDYGGIFNIGVYADDLKLGKNLLSIDDDLNLTIRSDRKDKVYHFVISETTELSKMETTWDQILVKYRYFFPLTIERNIQSLVDKKYFTIAYSDNFLNILSHLSRQGRIKAILATLVALGECTNEIYSYTQNVTQLADYLVYAKSKRENYQLPIGNDVASQTIREYYNTQASVSSRSLFVAFMEVCLNLQYITLDEVPSQYLDPNRTMYPYYSGQGGFYGFNTPTRIFNIKFNA